MVDGALIYPLIRIAAVFFSLYLVSLSRFKAKRARSIDSRILISSLIGISPYFIPIPMISGGFYGSVIISIMATAVSLIYLALQKRISKDEAIRAIPFVASAVFLTDLVAYHALNMISREIMFPGSNANIIRDILSRKQ